jgi:hypothetical protein
LVHLLEYLGGPLLTLSPPVYAAVVAVLWKGTRGWLKSGRSEYLYLLLAGVPLPLFFLALSLMVSVSMHWPAVGYLPLVVLAVGMIDRGELFSRRYLRATLAVSAGMTVLMHLTPFFAGALPDGIVLSYYGNTISAARLKGEMIDWPRLGEQIRSVYDRFGAAGDTIVMTPDFHLAAQLAFYSGLPDRFEVLTETREHAFSLWKGSPTAGRIRNGIVLLPFTEKNQERPRNEERFQEYLDAVLRRFGSYAWGPVLTASGAFNVPDERQFRLQVIYGYQYRQEQHGVIPPSKPSTFPPAARSPSAARPF